MNGDPTEPKETTPEPSEPFDAMAALRRRPTPEQVEAARKKREAELGGMGMTSATAAAIKERDRETLVTAPPRTIEGPKATPVSPKPVFEPSPSRTEGGPGIAGPEGIIKLAYQAYETWRTEGNPGGSAGAASGGERFGYENPEILQVEPESFQDEKVRAAWLTIYNVYLQRAKNDFPGRTQEEYEAIADEASVRLLDGLPSRGWPQVAERLKGGVQIVRDPKIWSIFKPS